MNPLPKDRDNELPDGYADVIRECSRLAREWMAAHPGSDAKVQFNYPTTVMLSAVPSDAIENHFVSINEQGRELLTHMGAFSDDPKSPSIFMVRMALELMKEIEEEEKDDQTTHHRR